MDQNGVKQYFERYGMRIEVKRETSICNPRLSDSYIYYLVEGIASLTSLTMDGEEKDFIYFPHDHLLGFAPALMRHYRKIRGESIRCPETTAYRKRSRSASTQRQTASSTAWMREPSRYCWKKTPVFSPTSWRL